MLFLCFLFNTLICFLTLFFSLFSSSSFFFSLSGHLKFQVAHATHDNGAPRSPHCPLPLPTLLPAATLAIPLGLNIIYDFRHSPCRAVCNLLRIHTLPTALPQLSWLRPALNIMLNFMSICHGNRSSVALTIPASQSQRSCASRGLRSRSGAATRARRTQRPWVPSTPSNAVSKCNKVSRWCSEWNISWHVSHHRWQIFESCFLECLLQLINDAYNVMLCCSHLCHLILIIYPENPLNWL